MSNKLIHWPCVGLGAKVPSRAPSSNARSQRRMNVAASLIGNPACTLRDAPACLRLLRHHGGAHYGTSAVHEVSPSTLARSTRAGSAGCRRALCRSTTMVSHVAARDGSCVDNWLLLSAATGLRNTAAVLGCTGVLPATPGPGFRTRRGPPLEVATCRQSLNLGLSLHPVTAAISQ
jgi:hypothetical protein